MSQKRKVIIFGSSRGIGKAIVDKLREKKKYDIVEVDRTRGYDLLQEGITLPVNKTDIFT